MKKNLGILRAAGLVTIVRRSSHGYVHVLKPDVIGDLHDLWMHKFIDRDRREGGD